MAKSRMASAPPPSARAYAYRASLTGGNGSPAPDATTNERLERVEALLERVQQSLDTQFRRIADLQVIIDRLTADRDRS